ncbi:MAG: VanZ family protein [Bacteroidota bacterium]
MNNRTKVWKIIFIVYLALLACVSISAYLKLIPTEVNRIPHYDTIMHFLLLGFASFLSFKATSGKKFLRIIPLWPFIIAIMASADEIIQIFFPARNFSYKDLVANLAGIFLFYLIAEFSKKRIKTQIKAY